MNIYLITGSSFRLMDKEIKKIINDSRYVFLNMSRNSIDELFDECGYSFFLDDMKYIVVKNLFKELKEKNEERIINYLNKPNEKVTVIFLEEKVDSRKKIIKTIKKNYKFIDLTVDYKNVYSIINDYIKENKFNYDYDLTKYLVGVYLLNIDLICAEIDKVFLYYDKPITLSVKSVENIIAMPINTNSFKFIDAVVNKNLELSQKLLEDLIICKTEITSLIILLAREYRLISYVKFYCEQKLNIKEISSKLKMQDWQIDKYYKNSLKYMDFELKNIIKMLALYDEKIKTGRLEKNSAIQLILLNIIL